MSQGMSTAMAADIATVQRIDAVPAILKLVCDVTGLGFAAVARVTDDSWTCCAVLDQIAFGMKVGDPLEVNTTLCKEVKDGSQTIVIRHAREEAAFCEHPTPKMYGFESYISTPVVLRSGRFFGTLCALDPNPAELDARAIATVELLAAFVAAQFDIEQQLAESHAALSSETETGGLRDQFIAVLGHDLRNPLSSMLAGVDLLGKQTLDDRGRYILDQMRQSGRRMAGLIDDILDFARGRLGGGIPVHRRTVGDLSADLERVVSEMQSAHPERRIYASLRVEAPVDCDPARVGQLLSNLLGNAVTHGSPDHPIEVQASTADGLFELKVTNWGDPIPREEMARMFMPYTRREQEMPQGLGLGLYISAEIARAHAGTLTVDSSPAEGTSFAFRCPTAI